MGGFSQLLTQMAAARMNQPPQPEPVSNMTQTQTEMPQFDQLAIAQSLAGLGKSGGIDPTQPPPKPPGKGAMFRDLLREYMLNVGQALAGAGTGPGADARAFGLAVVAPYQREERDKRFELERQQQASLDQYRRAQAQALAAQQEVVEVPDPVTGQAIQIPKKNFGDWFRARSAQMANETKKEIAGKQIASKEKIAISWQNARASLTQAQTELAQMRAQVLAGQIDPSSPLFQQKERAIQARIEAAKNAQALRMMALNQAAERSERPTASARDRAAFAYSLRSHIPEIRAAIKDLQGDLGPLAGRWNDIMTGKIGAENPKYWFLATELSLLASGLMVPHVGARGGTQLVKRFDKLFASSLNPANLEAALNATENFLSGYEKLPEIQMQQAADRRGPKPTHRFNPATGKVEPIAGKP